MVWAVSLLHVKLIPHKLTPVQYIWEFGVWLTSESGLHPLDYSVLYLLNLTYQASPKTISRRTSYHQVRLAFHPYTQLMQNLFNGWRFEPPSPVKGNSLCPGIDHLASGLMIGTNALSNLLSLRIRDKLALNTYPCTYQLTRRIILQ